MDDTARETASQTRSACTECQRRKQKCNREWPCNHCQKRKVADKCRFNTPKTASDKTAQEIKKNGSQQITSAEATAPVYQQAQGLEPVAQLQAPVQNTRKKRQLNRDDDDDYANDDENDGDDDDDLGLGNMGYMTSHQFASLGIGTKGETRKPRLFCVKASANSYLERALETMPERSHMDAMVQNFFDNVNYHYYIIYPPVFLQEYKEWWVDRNRGSALSLQWTCLLLTVCSCACQHLPVDVQEKLEHEIGETASHLSEKYHNMARELGSAMPVGYYHMYKVQWLLHSTYWFKAEARFLECWHVLGAAAREAQELGFHKKEAAEHLSEFEREMRRRVWCVIDCWDWQISSGLFRPTIIDHTECTVELPTLTLEDFSPSPLMHMKLQSELIHQLAAKFGAPKNINSTQHVKDYKKIIDDWMQRFPPAYALESPDTSGDEKRPWIRFHRHYIHTMGYMMLLNPIRSFMATTITPDSPSDELEIRAIGVDYALREMDVLRDWVDFVSYRDGRFHFIIFALFDTSAVLSTALIKDEVGTIPCRNDIYNMIDSAVAMLKDLMILSPTAKMSYDILYKIVRKVPRPAGFLRNAPTRKRYKGMVGMEASRVQVPPAMSALASSKYDHMPISRVHVPVQPSLPPLPPPSSSLPSAAAAAAAATAARADAGVYVPTQPLVNAPVQHLSIYTGIHVPVQPMIYVPPPVRAPVRFPAQPPTPPGPSADAEDYIPQVGDPSQGQGDYVPLTNLYGNAVMPQQPQHGNMTASVAESTLASLDAEAFCATLQASQVVREHIDDVSMNHSLRMNGMNDMNSMNGTTQAGLDPFAAPSPEEQGDRITDAELGELATLWNWQSLNLPFISSERVA